MTTPPRLDSDLSPRLDGMDGRLTRLWRRSEHHRGATLEWHTRAVPFRPFCVFKRRPWMGADLLMAAP